MPRARRTIDRHEGGRQVRDRRGWRQRGLESNGEGEPGSDDHQEAIDHEEMPAPETTEQAEGTGGDVPARHPKWGESATDVGGVHWIGLAAVGTSTGRLSDRAAGSGNGGSRR